MKNIYKCPKCKKEFDSYKKKDRYIVKHNRISVDNATFDSKEEIDDYIKKLEDNLKNASFMKKIVYIFPMVENITNRPYSICPHCGHTEDWEFTAEYTIFDICPLLPPKIGSESAGRFNISGDSQHFLFFGSGNINGSGEIKTEHYYYFFKEHEEGGFMFTKKPASKIRIMESETDRPQYRKYGYRGTDVLIIPRGVCVR